MSLPYSANWIPASAGMTGRDNRIKKYMKNKHFYSHLVEIESLVVDLDQLELAEGEKYHLAQLADSNLHNAILDAILSELDEEHKKLFLEHLNEGNHDKIWQFLNEKTSNIEEKIKNVADQLKEEMRKDIKESKKLKGKN